MLIQAAVCYPKTSNVSSPSRTARIEQAVRTQADATSSRPVQMPVQTFSAPLSAALVLQLEQVPCLPQ
jgi:hypothetical protein